MENREGLADHNTAAPATDDYHVSLSDLEPTRGITDCLDDVIFGLCDTRHTETLACDPGGGDHRTSQPHRHSAFCRHLRLTTNADTVYLCKRQSLCIVTTTSTDFTDDTNDMHGALMSSISNLSDCSEPFQLADVRVFPDHAKLSFSVIPVSEYSTPEKLPGSNSEYLAVIVDADEEYGQINRCIAEVVQAIFTTFIDQTQPTGKQLQRSVFDQLKRTINLCSEKITVRRQEIFFDDLRHVTVHFEKLIALNSISPNLFSGNTVDSISDDGFHGNVSNTMQSTSAKTLENAGDSYWNYRSDPFIWGWQSVASLLEDDQYPQALHQQAELWGNSFTTALDTHMLREAVFRYKEVCESANLISCDTIKPLCITVYPQSLLDDGYIDTLQKLTEMAVIRGQQLVLELSEKTSVRTNATETEAELRDYQCHLQSYREKLGLRFGLCEFGTGHSSLLRATILGPDVIKLPAALLPDNQLAISEWVNTVSQLPFGTVSADTKSDELKQVQILVDATQLPLTTNQAQITADTTETVTGGRQTNNTAALLTTGSDT